jgi:hypothetical protein
MLAPPVAPAVNVISADASLAAATTLVGADGLVEGVADVADDAEDLPS